MILGKTLRWLASLPMEGFGCLYAIIFAMAKELEFHERMRRYNEFTDELRAAGPIPSEELAKEEKDWVAAHPEYAVELMRKGQIHTQIRLLLAESPSANREKIAALLVQSQTGLDRVRMAREKAAMAKLQGK